MVTNVETSTPLHPPPQTSALVSKQTSASSKKKKKRRNGASAATGSGSENSSASASPPPSEAQDDSMHSDTSPATMERWKHRVQSLRSSLSQVQAENRILSADLKAATARANDAEQAETAVNKGLLTARSVISQRDRSVAELNALASNQRADFRRLEEEKKKLDRRLVLLKTVSANLQEAREERDCAEKKTEELQSNSARLKKKLAQKQQLIDEQGKQLQVLELKEKQVDKLQCQLNDLREDKLSAEEQAARRSVMAAGASALCGVVAGVAFCLLTRARNEEDRETR
ncbi:hypothetical protein FGB62_112g213 [Gracilaria domingensis]|nr:hypothetical protein FGB62_112g213 [Gracilaria domingensis]